MSFSGAGRRLMAALGAAGAGAGTVAVSACAWDANWDCAAPAEGAGRCKGSRVVVLVRHGQYVHDDERHLTELGRRQAAATGKRLRELQLPFERVQASDVTRAAETCDIIVQELERLRPWEVELNQLFREGAPIQPDPPHPTWQPSEDDFFREGARMEAVRCAAARMVAAAHSRAQGFRDLFRRPVDLEKNSYELVVCHGNVIRYWCMRALQLEPQAWLRLSHANCGITVLKIHPDGDVNLQEFGSSGHLARDLITYN